MLVLENSYKEKKKAKNSLCELWRFPREGWVYKRVCCTGERGVLGWKRDTGRMKGLAVCVPRAGWWPSVLGGLKIRPAEARKWWGIWWEEDGVGRGWLARTTRQSEG